MNILKINGISTNLSSRTNAKNRADKQYASNGLYKDTISFTANADLAESAIEGLQKMPGISEGFVSRLKALIEETETIIKDAEEGRSLKPFNPRHELREGEAYRIYSDDNEQKPNDIFGFMRGKLVYWKQRITNGREKALGYSERTVHFRNNRISAYKEIAGKTEIRIKYDPAKNCYCLAPKE